MLSYPVDEAETLLTSKLAAAKLSYNNCDEDLDFLREQITVRPPRHVLLLLIGVYHDVRSVARGLIIISRPWRSPWRESITGTSCRSGKRKPRRMAKEKG